MLFNEYIAAARRAQKRATDEERRLQKWAVDTYLKLKRDQGIKDYQFTARMADDERQA